MTNRWYSIVAISHVYLSVAPPKDSFGDLLGTMGMPAPVQPAAVTNGETKAEEVDMSPGMVGLFLLSFQKCQLIRNCKNVFVWKAVELKRSQSLHANTH